MKNYLLFEFWFESMSWSGRLVVDFGFSSPVIHKKYIYRYVFQPRPPRVFDFSVYPWQQYFLRLACYHLAIYCWRQKLMIDLHCLDLESFWNLWREDMNKFSWNGTLFFSTYIVVCSNHASININSNWRILSIKFPTESIEWTENHCIFSRYM